MSVRGWAKALKRDVLMLWLAARDPEVPLAAKLIAGAVAAYALSPIDLIPDFIPALGLLDDLIVVPLGILAARALISRETVDRLRVEAAALAERPASRGAAALIVAIWVFAGVLLFWWLTPYAAAGD